MNIAIIGSEETKFNNETRLKAIGVIGSLLNDLSDTLVSGHCPLGGIDIWAEDLARTRGLNLLIFAPKRNNWSAPGGYRDRNIDIAHNCDQVHVIVPKWYPDSYKGSKFRSCYHCDKRIPAILSHIKSGACWTAWLAKDLGKSITWHIVSELGLEIQSC